MLVLVEDTEVERLAVERGPESPEAHALADLRAMRAQDQQAYVFRLDGRYVVGPMPDALTEGLLTILSVRAGWR